MTTAKEHIERLMSMIDGYRPMLSCCWADSLLEECDEACIYAQAQAYLDSENRKQLEEQDG